jgi:uncharacterized damage-inducible protein DinB
MAHAVVARLLSATTVRARLLRGILPQICGAHDMTDTHVDPARYPIGTFARRATYSAEERAAHIARLAAVPAALASAISGLDDTALDMPYREGGWTVRQLVHHVADSHANAYIRVKLALTEVDPTIKPYDQDAWVQLADVREVSPLVSVGMVAAIHARLDAALRAMQPEDFARGLMHPESGRMTLDMLVALYAWHGDHHVAHIRNMRANLTP